MKQHISPFLKSRVIRPQIRRKTVLSLFFGLAFPLISSGAPIVTVIDDDALNEKSIRSVKEVADRCGIKVTFAPVAAYLLKSPKVAALLRQYVQEGHEIASHSLSHRSDVWKSRKVPDIKVIEHEMAESERIFKNFQLYPKSFVYPFGNFPAGHRKVIFDIVSRYYPVAFNARGDINLPGKMYPLYISRHPLRNHNSLFMMKRLIDDAAAAEKSWVVILTHSGKSDFSAEMLEKIIRYAQKSGAVFLTASEAWKKAAPWPMAAEDQIQDYSRFMDLLNAAYFHLPLLLAAGFGMVMICGGVISFFYIRRRRRFRNSPDCL